MFIICKIQNCGFHSENGFCLNRLVAINEQGICDYLTKPGWDQPVEDMFKNNYNPREPVQEEPETRFERYLLDDISNW